MNRNSASRSPNGGVIAVLGAFAPLSSNEICERTAMDKAKVSRAVATLLKRGLIEREAHQTDQRLIQLTLSKAGRKIYEAIIPRARAIEAEVTKGLSKADIAQLARACLTASAPVSTKLRPSLRDCCSPSKVPRNELPGS